MYRLLNNALSMQLKNQYTHYVYQCISLLDKLFWRHIMKRQTKLTLIFILSLLSFTGCSQKINIKDVYISEYNNLTKTVNDLNLYSNIKEVTRECPGILSDNPYKNYDNVYYIVETKNSNKSIEINNESVDNINALINNYFERIIIDREENIIIFQTISEFGYGEYLIYSKDKIQQSDKTLVLSTWLDDNWYIATSN